MLVCFFFIEVVDHVDVTQSTMEISLARSWIGAAMGRYVTHMENFACNVTFTVTLPVSYR
jgi:hypothetical protein